MNAPAGTNQKAELLQKTVEHVDITSFDARPIIDAMRQMSFSSRDTARAADPAQRDNITATTSALAALGGAWAVRVHQVIPSREAIAAASLWKESR